MSTQPRLARLATDALARERVHVSPAKDAERERIVAMLAETIKADARRRRVRRTAFLSGLAVAAGVSAVIGGRSLRKHSADASAIAPLSTNAGASPAAMRAPDLSLAATRESGDVRVWSAGTAHALDERASPLAAMDRIVADDGGAAMVRLSTGTVLRVGSSTDFTVLDTSTEQRFVLKTGTVRADVAKLAIGQRFLVRTDDAEVEVRGTSFRVSVVPPSAACGSTSKTRVVVYEGIVAVRTANGEVQVHAGYDWPRGCSEPSTPRAPEGAASAPRPPRVEPRPLAHATAPSEPPTVDAGAASKLADENALYAEGVAARRRGDAHAALAFFALFIERYPSSGLAENATVERMRLLAASDLARAVVAANAYLAQYPNGFAREEAARLAAGEP